MVGDMLRQPVPLDDVFTLEQARAIGWTPDAVRHAVTSGAWRRLHRGVYAVRDLGPTPILRARAAVLATGGVASHATAERVWSMWAIDGRDHVTVAADRHRRKRPGLRVHRDRLDATEVVLVEGVPVTNPFRTCRDLGREGSLWETVCAVESALRVGHLATGQLADLAATSPVAKRAAALVDTRSESPLETCARLVYREAGIELVPQLVVPAGGMSFRLDLADPEHRIAVECDGRSVHDAPTALYADRHRANLLAAAGWIILRVTWWDVFNRPETLVAQFRAAVARAS